MPSFLAELKRRNVFRVAAVYLAGAWLLAQVTGLLGQWFEWPTVVVRILLILFVLGFPVALFFAWLFELTPEGIKRTREVEPSASVRPVTGRKLDRVLVVVLGALVVLLLADRLFIMGPGAAVGEGTRASDESSQRAGQSTIAVLAFADMSPGQDQEYFADGITEEILNSLARVRELEVAGRTSSFQFKGRNEDLKTIGEVLGVRHILEGSVRKAGDRLRITAQLNNAETGYHLWSRTYDRPLDDIFAVQEDIARSVAEALQISLGVGQLGRLPGMTRSIEAYDAFLAARALGGEGTVASNERGVEQLRHAIALDPSFAIAWGVLAGMYTDLATLSGSDEWRNKRDEAIDELTRRLPDSSLAMLVLGSRSVNRSEWGEAARQYDAMRSGGGLPDAIVSYTYGSFLLFTGHSKAAVIHLEQARRLDPLSGFASIYLAEALANSGNLSAAITEHERGLTLQDSQAVLRPVALITALAAGDQALIAQLLNLVTSAPDSLGPTVNVAMKRYLDRPAEALAELRRLAERLPPAEASIAAHWAAYFGDPELALQLLQGIRLRERGFLLSVTIWRPLMRDVRKLPAFKDFVRDMGLVDYWREFGWADLCRPVESNDFECV